jgi:spore cortex formation protein SpoVR/YcgB (stage V sporulation)
MMQDIERISVDPTEEDRAWFPEIAGSRDPYEVLKDVWANYRDESFVAQFLSPRLMRQWRMFQLVDDADQSHLRVEAIHDERGYRRIRRALARQYDVAWLDPDIQVVDVDLAGDRKLILHHNVLNRILLDEADARRVLQHLADLWGYDVVMQEIEPSSGTVLKEHAASARRTFF